MYLIAQLFNALNDRIKAEVSKKVDVQFWNGNLDDLFKKQATGAFLVFMDFPSINYLASGAGYGGQQAQIEFSLLIAIRDQASILDHLKIIDTITRPIHGWTPAKEAAYALDGWTPIVRKSASVDDRFEYPLVYRISFNTTANDRNSEAYEWSKTNFDIDTVTELNIDVQIEEPA
jgi:hypothetical protein